MTKEDEKIPNYSSLANKIRKMHQVFAEDCACGAWLFGCGVWSVVGFFERSRDSGYVGRNAGICSHWDYPNPPEDA